MGDVSKSAGGTVHGNTLYLRFMKIIFQVFPGTAGTDAQRGIAGVPYSINTTSGLNLIQTGDKTNADGSIEIFMAEDETAVLRIFDTDFLITFEDTIEELNKLDGMKRRLSLLGYYTGAINADIDKQTDLAILNLQADSHLNAEGWDSLHYKMQEYIGEELKKRFGE